MLKSHCDGASIHSSHKQSKQTSDCQEFMKSPTVNSSNLQDAHNEHVEDHRPFAAESITCETEDSGTDGAEEKRKSQGCGDVGVVCFVIGSELCGLDGNRMVVKCISCPCKEAVDEEEPL
jgi:hypothetical protein